MILDCNILSFISEKFLKSNSPSKSNDILSLFFKEYGFCYIFCDIYCKVTQKTYYFKLFCSDRYIDLKEYDTKSVICSYPLFIDKYYYFLEYDWIEFNKHYMKTNPKGVKSCSKIYVIRQKDQASIYGSDCKIHYSNYDLIRTHLFNENPFRISINIYKLYR